MPLLNGKKFVPSPPPPKLRLEERVFQNTITGEIFRDYESFHKQSLLCKSLLWSCEYTGKSNLTYSEAVKSERDAEKQIAGIPDAVKHAVLLMIHQCQRSSLWQLYEEVWMMVKDRYYKNEEVDVTLNKKRLKGKVLHVVLPPPENGVADGCDKSSQLPSPAPFTPVLELTGLETLSMSQSPLHLSESSGTIGDSSYEIDSEKDKESSISKQSPSKKRKKSPKSPICSAALLDPSRYKYSVEVKDVNGVEIVELPASDVMRVRNSITREKLRLFIRFATYKQENSDKYPLLVKDKFVNQYELGDRPFIPGPIEPVPPSRIKSPKKRKFSQSSIESYFNKSKDSTPKKKKKKMDLVLNSKTPEKTPSKVKKPRTPTPHKAERKWSKDALKKMLRHRRMTPKRREHLNKELKKILEEEKEKRKAEKEIVRKQVKEQKEKEKEIKREEEERLREWYRPREDLLLDDSQPLPPVEPLPYQLSTELFPHAVMVLEYLRLFAPLFDIDGPKPNIISYAKLEECLLDCDPDCTLYNILRFLLLALFVTMDDEEEKELSLSSSELSANKMNHGESVKVSEEPGGVASEQAMDLLPQGTEDAPEEGKEVSNPKEEDDLDEQLPINEGAFSSASIYATWALRHQGISLHSIQLDYFTITEILRLHLLSSGQTKSTSACRLFRYQSRGGYASSDDPGIEFCRRNKALLQKMSRVPVYDLPPEEKLLLISVLCHQLLTYSVIRDALDESAASLKAARRTYKNLCSELERLNKPGRRKKEKREVLNSKDNVETGEGSHANDSHVSKNKRRKKKLSKNKMPSRTDGISPCDPINTSPKPNNPEVEMGGEEDEMETDVEAKRQELLEGMNEAMKEVIQHSQATNLQPLGQDRWRRVYWWFPSMPGLYVERTGDVRCYVQSPSKSLPIDPLLCPNDPLWSRYPADEETIGDLMAGLNSRGIRESQLREQLSQHKDEMIASSEKLLRRREAKTRTNEYQSAEDYMELSLRDHLLELEDNVYCGNLGYVRSEVSRADWIKSIENSALAEKYRQLKENKGKPAENRPREGVPENQDLLASEVDIPSTGSLPPSPSLEVVPVPSSGLSTPFVNPSVRDLAAVLLSIQEGIESRFLKQPFGKGVEEALQGTRRLKKTEPDKQMSPPVDQWMSSLKSCTSFSQIFIHLYTLDRVVIWSKSLQNIRCRKCRKKGGDEYLLLCDRCDNGYHTYCLDPPLVEIPDNDWFCNNCQPASPVKLRRVSSVRRRTAQEDSDEESRDKTSDEESSDTDTPPRRRQANRRNIPLPRRSARIISKKQLSEDSEDSNDSESSEAENSEEEEESALLLLQLKTEGVLEDLHTSSAGTRAHNSKVKQLHESLLDELLEHEDGFILQKLPKKTEAPGYYKLIKDPVDLHMLKVKANTEGYLRSDAFVHDVQRMFDNNFKYYKEGPEYQCGQKLEEYFHLRLEELGMTPKNKNTAASKDKGTPVDEDGVPEDARTRTCIAVTELKDMQSGTRLHNAKTRTVHERLLDELSLHVSGAFLEKLPSRKKCPDYYEVVQDPVDLQQLKVRAKKEGFESHDQFHKEVQRMVENTFIYYGDESEEGMQAQNVDNYLDKRLKELGLVSRKLRGRKRRNL